MSNHNNANDYDPLFGMQPYKMDLHCRQQLSAMKDGALAPDQARFLLRRLQHDSDLAACWERWQLVGDSMRGHAHALLPPDFAQRVALAIADAPASAQAIDPSARATPRTWVRWGGGAALAASVALVSLLAVRQLPGTGDTAEPATSAPARIATTAPNPVDVAQTRVATTQPSATTTPQPATPHGAGNPAAFATAVAVADVPRRISERQRRARSGTANARQAAQPTLVRAASNDAAPVLVADSTTRPTPTMTTTHATDPFAASEIPSRPWPRAVLPGLSGNDNGVLTVGFGGRQGASAEAFYPFAPGARVVMPDLQHATDADVVQRADESPSP